MREFTYWVTGTTCRSCELTIERCWKKLPGVKKVHVNAATGEARIVVDEVPKLSVLQQALGDEPYVVHSAAAKMPSSRPSAREVAGLFLLVLFVLYIFSKIGLFKATISLNSSLGFGAVFLVGLLAASSSCVAVVGGLLLSVTAKFNERYASATFAGRLRPVLLFVVGRVASYTILGGLLGVAGSVLAPTPLFMAVIAFIAAGYMIIMGLEMLHLAPRFTQRLMPRLPKRWQHSILDVQHKEHWGMPMMLGAATFFLPCGFTQALQLYALTTHSFWGSAVVLLGFALGTAPALIILGMAAGSAKGKFGKWVFKFSGALVIVLGLWNMQNAFAIAGHPLTWPPGSSTIANSPVGVVEQAGVQVVKMTVDVSGYHPNHFTLKAGVPVRWEIDGTQAGGCASVLISRQLSIQKYLSAGTNVITFTPPVAGDIAFSCSMGMYRGSFTVIN